MATNFSQYEPGMKVRVTQQIPHGKSAWTSSVDDRLWIDRLEIRKEDGEIVVCNLDQYSRVEVIGRAPASEEGAA